MSSDGAAIDIVFDEDLDASGTAPAADAFEVAVDGGTAVNPDSVAFHATDADTVVLTMSPAIAAGGTVTVAYDQPTSNALADAASNEVADFTGQAAPNRPAAPVVTLTAGDEKLTATWSAPANGGSAITGYDVEWKTAAQTWAQAATAGQSATAADDATDHEISGLTNNTAYTVRVRAGNDAGNGPWSAEASETPIAGDTTAPEASSAQVSSDGAAIDIVFDEDLDTSGSAPAADAFEVAVDGGTAVNPASVAFHATDADTVVLTMSPAIAAGGTVTVAYDQPTSNALADAASNEVADFTQTVLNRPAAPVVTLTAGDEKLTATWSAPANGGSEVTGYDVEWKTAAQTWAQAATAGQAATPAADATDHEISGLTNDTEYTVRVRAGNDTGDGPWSDGGVGNAHRRRHHRPGGVLGAGVLRRRGHRHRVRRGPGCQRHGARRGRVRGGRRRRHGGQSGQRRLPRHRRRHGGAHHEPGHRRGRDGHGRLRPADFQRPGRRREQRGGGLHRPSRAQPPGRARGDPDRRRREADGDVERPGQRRQRHHRLRRGVEDRRPDLGSGRHRRAGRHACRRRNRP